MWKKWFKCDKRQDNGFGCVIKAFELQTLSLWCWLSFMLFNVVVIVADWRQTFIKMSLIMLLRAGRLNLKQFWNLLLGFLFVRKERRKNFKTNFYSNFVRNFRCFWSLRISEKSITLEGCVHKSRRWWQRFCFISFFFVTVPYSRSSAHTASRAMFIKSKYPYLWSITRW